MDSSKKQDLLPDELRQYMARTGEKHYLLIDVRQPGEYAVAHIPGARLMPLLELEAHIFDLPADRELLFYCNAGPRSEIAADLAVEAAISELPVYNLIGGMLAWDGHKLSDLPRVQVFDQARPLPDLLMTAMDLEKGACRYYRILLDLIGQMPFRPLIAQLSREEEAHARLIHSLWQPTQAEPQSFEALFERLPGEILEGGQPLADVSRRLPSVPADAGLRVLELSLDIEYRAYDLYRNMAEGTMDEGVREALLIIAQAEKSHMRRLTRAIADFF